MSSITRSITLCSGRTFDFIFEDEREEAEKTPPKKEKETQQEEEVIEIPGPLKEFPSLDQFRMELQSISRFGDLNNKLQRESKMKKVFPFHYVFTIDPGMGLSKVLNDLAYKLYQYDIIAAPKVLEYNGSLSINTRDSSAGKKPAGVADGLHGYGIRADGFHGGECRGEIS